jgi:acyl-CoA synthetase (AMP-forming)/AMP-acid ligase II
MAVVLLEPGRVVSADEIANAVHEKKGAVQAPKRVEYVEALPLSAVGKPDKKALRAQFAE